MSTQDFQDLLGASREMCTYFTFICQFMLTYLIYSILKILFISVQADVSDAFEHRMFDLLSILISISNMLMLYGVSLSIKKSVNR